MSNAALNYMTMKAFSDATFSLAEFIDVKLDNLKEKNMKEQLEKYYQLYVETFNKNIDLRENLLELVSMLEKNEKINNDLLKENEKLKEEKKALEKSLSRDKKNLENHLFFIRRTLIESLKNAINAYKEGKSMNPLSFAWKKEDENVKHKIGESYHMSDSNTFESFGMTMSDVLWERTFNNDFYQADIKDDLNVIREYEEILSKENIRL